MKNLIEIKNLKKYYYNGKVKALDDVSLSLEEGKVYGLIGQNGAGKTTLVKMIVGATHPTEGTISIYGEEAGSIVANKKIGYVYEGNALPVNENPYEYLLTMAILSKIKIKDAKPKILKLLSQFGLDKFKYTKMKKFSSGMKKKVQIIAALLNDPSLLILDEPTANLDPQVRFEVFNFIKNTVLKQNITVILCSHNLFELEKIVDDIIMIRKGKMVIKGSYHEIINTIKSTNQLQINTSDNEQTLKFIESLNECTIMSKSPMIVNLNNPKLFKENLIEFSYKNKIIIEEMFEVRDSIFELFDHFNKEDGGVLENVSV